MDSINSIEERVPTPTSSSVSTITPLPSRSGSRQTAFEDGSGDEEEVLVNNSTVHKGDEEDDEEENEVPNYTNLQSRFLGKCTKPTFKLSTKENSLPTQTTHELSIIETSLTSMITTISQPRILSKKHLSKGLWRDDLQLVCLFIKRGNFFTSLGRYRKDLKCDVLEPEEAMWLIERGSLLLYRSNDMRVLESEEMMAMSVQECYQCLFKSEMDLKGFVIYSYLKRLGYVVKRYGEYREILRASKEKERENGKRRLKKTTLKAEKSEVMMVQPLWKRVMQSIWNVYGSVICRVGCWMKRFMTQRATGAYGVLGTVYKRVWMGVGCVVIKDEKSKLVSSQDDQLDTNGPTKPLVNFDDVHTNYSSVYNAINIIPCGSLDNGNESLKEEDDETNIIDFCAWTPIQTFRRGAPGMPKFMIRVVSIGSVEDYYGARNVWKCGTRFREEYRSVLSELKDGDDDEVDGNGNEFKCQLKIAMVDNTGVSVFLGMEEVGERETLWKWKMSERKWVPNSAHRKPANKGNDK